MLNYDKHFTEYTKLEKFDIVRRGGTDKLILAHAFDNWLCQRPEIGCGMFSDLMSMDTKVRIELFACCDTVEEVIEIYDEMLETNYFE